MKITLPLLAVAALLLAGCGKKTPEKPVEPPAQKPEVATAAAAPSDSIGGAPKRTIDDARATIDAVRQKESSAAGEVR